MSAYVLVEIEVLNKERYEEYRQLAPPSIAAYGGRYLARGGAVENLEGTWLPTRLVILEFPSVDQAKAWWDSAEYAQAKAIRHAVARSQMIVAEGL